MANFRTKKRNFSHEQILRHLHPIHAITDRTNISDNLDRRHFFDKKKIIKILKENEPKYDYVGKTKRNLEPGTSA